MQTFLYAGTLAPGDCLGSSFLHEKLFEAGSGENARINSSVYELIFPGRLRKTIRYSRCFMCKSFHADSLNHLLVVNFYIGMFA